MTLLAAVANGSDMPTAPLPAVDRPRAFAAPVLVLGEDDRFCASVGRQLEGGGHTVCVVRGGPDQLARVPAGAWLAVIVDASVGATGYLEALRDLRGGNDVPVLLVGADPIAGLEAGADACLPTNSSPRQILARLRAVTRRGAAQEELAIAELRIAPAARRASLSGHTLALTPGEFDLLLSLARACGRVKTRMDLYTECRARAYGAADRAVDVQLSGLRRKLGDDPRRPRFIRTVRSAGYMLVPPDAPLTPVSSLSLA